MSNDVLPEQETLRRRLRAARLMQRVESLEELAARIDPTEKLSARTLRKLENRESEITLRALRPIAAALDVPLEWFTTPEPVWAPYRAAPGEDFEARLRRLESSHDELGELVRQYLEARTEADASSPRPRSKPRAPRSSRRSSGQ